MKKSILSSLLIAAGLIFSSVANAGEISDRVNQSKTILVGTEGTYAPFTFHDKTGKLSRK